MIVIEAPRQNANDLIGRTRRHCCDVCDLRDALLDELLLEPRNHRVALRTRLDRSRIGPEKLRQERAEMSSDADEEL